MSEQKIEHTLALIKPDGMPFQKDILARLKKEGFKILNQRTVHLTPEQVSDFYQDHYGHLDFPLLVASTSASPVLVLLLGRPRAIEKLKEIVGPSNVKSAAEESPDCLNAKFGNIECNLPAVHASQDIPNAFREINFFFSQSFVEPSFILQQNMQYLNDHVRPLLNEGLAELLKEKPAEPLLWLAGWLLEHNPNMPTTQHHLRHQCFGDY